MKYTCAATIVGTYTCCYYANQISTRKPIMMYQFHITCLFAPILKQNGRNLIFKNVREKANTYGAPFGPKVFGKKFSFGKKNFDSEKLFRFGKNFDFFFLSILLLSSSRCTNPFELVCVNIFFDRLLIIEK